MIKPDDVKVLDESDEKRVAAIEAHISEQLKVRKGTFHQPMWKGSNDDRPDVTGLVLGKGDVSDAVWAEVARRCLEAGWTLTILPPAGHGPRIMKIVHPLAVLPGEYVLRTDAPDTQEAE
jgi:hypothetical protein